MKLAFCLFKYFPYGGLQRDFLRIARECHQRGHEIHVYTMQWDGEQEPAFHMHYVTARGWQNHTRCYSFAEQVQSALAQEQYDLVIGFNKMPNLDVYYAADVCYQARVKEQRKFYYRWLPRYRHMKALEQGVFAKGNKAHVLLISALQQQEYSQHYQTETNRFRLLPPGIAKERMAPENAAEIRSATRKTHHIADEDFLILLVGSGFKTKGLDRAIKALAALPANMLARSQLFVIGQDNPTAFIKLAKRLNVNDKLHFLGGRPDVMDFMLAADLLLHPAYHENTGTVLLEAIVAGLPVLTVEVCGYAHYVEEATAGVVLPVPFQQQALNASLQIMLLSAKRNEWRQNGLAFSKHANIYSMPQKAVDFIEHIGRQRESIST